ncbi:outer-membrane receptor for ferric coprogen and ferric-rhodotorulic acid [Paracoccus aminovorans]|uniref:Outer-membrane receptor for ferric coprogen and ferric-rhodotorulic acid n=1 Tax=Paracoccus aminovorans TaxID=34004 RepID=A0A1I3C0K5_9RHOB|nr:TonB-dependent siderophore receptor [Paracoccus aminovorans]CQR87039.1 outer membrane ferric siderophore receptor [Paracoccus aminovorans]SFH68000.1 outer-membrane receptor for ferric coprogen and ferric-rhodotorulic acid [Paracoccus aminovorans]
MTYRPLISFAARARLTTALSAGILALAVPAMAQQAQDGSGTAVTLDEVTITAAPGTQTEGTDSWTTEWMRSATGLVLSQKETPQSTSVITDAQMKDRNITTIAETMDAATGITVQAFESDRINYYSRGFPIDAYQYDSAPVPRDVVYQFGDNNPDMALYDHVEIVRGATGLMSGAGEPGASINFIRKRPTEVFQSEAAFSLADPKGARVEADVSGPLNASGSVRGRLVGVVDKRDGFLDNYTKDKYVLFGAVEVDIDENTVLSTGISYQKTNADAVTWAGLPSFYADGGLIDWPDGSTMGTDWTYVDTARTDAFASLEHVFRNGWTGRLVLSHIRTDSDMQLSWANGAPDRDGSGLSLLSAAKYDGRSDVSTLNAMVNGDFQAMGRDHQFVLGAMMSYASATNDSYSALTGIGTPIENVFDWNGGPAEPVWSDGPTSVGKTTARQYGVYGTLQFHATDALALIGGARASWWSGSDATDGVTTLDYSYDAEITPYVGATYDLTPVWTAYGSITSIFKPQLAQDVDGNYLDPAYGWNYELGVKGDPLDGRLYVSAAIFQTDQKDVAEYLYYDLEEDRSVYRSIDGTKTRGFEVEAAGAINDRWNVSAGYTYRTSKDQDGNKLYADQPQHTLKLATDYRLAALQDKLTLGGAMRWQSGTDSMDFTSELEQPNVHQGSYAVFDLNAKYDLNDKTALSLSVNNIFDKKYYATTGFYDTVVYGDGRSAELTLRAKF